MTVTGCKSRSANGSRCGFRQARPTAQVVSGSEIEALAASHGMVIVGLRSAGKARRFGRTGFVRVRIVTGVTRSFGSEIVLQRVRT